MTNATTRDKFTLKLLEWTPWLELATDTDLTPEERKRVEAVVGAKPNFAYQAVLANDLPALQARALVHHHTYASDDPAQTAWRELGATTASRINGCVFCASVHARLYASNSGNRDLIQTFLDDGLDANLPPTARAVVDLAAKVTVDPEALTGDDFAALRELGFDDLGILDIINYAAFFGNANRLMLTLGEPQPSTRVAS